MNGVDLVAKILKAEGVEWISCFPSNPVISAVAREGIKPIAFRHERGAVMAADGYSRISDRKRFGVVAVTMVPASPPSSSTRHCRTRATATSS